MPLLVFNAIVVVQRRCWCFPPTIQRHCWCSTPLLVFNAIVGVFHQQLHMSIKTIPADLYYHSSSSTPLLLFSAIVDVFHQQFNAIVVVQRHCWCSRPL